ncbi:MAG: ABC transporter permease, partial [Candidatus Diapherotrites archaeon]
MLRLSLSNIFRYKLRSFLAILGISLGVASLIALVSIVDGIRADIEDAFSQVQGLRVVPKKASDPIYNYLDVSWISKIEKVKGVKVVVPVIIQASKSIDNKEMQFFGSVRILGLDLQKQATANGSGFSGELLEGRDFKSNDSGVVLIGKKIKDDFRKFLGSKINVNGKSFSIIGVYTTGSDLLDNSIIMSINDVRSITDFPKDKVSYLNVQAVSPTLESEVVDRINLIYGNDVTARSLNDFSSQFGSVFNNITLLVLVVASIASLVASVGVINTMLMSVLERFREIGALKAVGWSNGDVMRMVLYESGFLGVIGGLLGVVFGLFLSFVIVSFGLPSKISF